MNARTTTEFDSIDADIFNFMKEFADKYSHGHFTIMKFTSNWRVAFDIPGNRDDIQEMIEGRTFQEAAARAMASFGSGQSPRESIWLPEIDWSRAPDWAQWSAIDKGGSQSWYEFKPFLFLEIGAWHAGDNPAWATYNEGDSIPESREEKGGSYGYRARYQESLRQRPNDV